MRSSHNAIRALALCIGLMLLVVTGTAAMMAAFSGPSPATDMYRRVATTPAFEPATPMATASDTVLYERVVLADGRSQWVLVNEPDTSLATLAQASDKTTVIAANRPAHIYAGSTHAVSYTLVARPTGLSKPSKNCSTSAYVPYDISCTTAS